MTHTNETKWPLAPRRCSQECGVAVERMGIPLPLTGNGIDGRVFPKGEHS